MAMAGLSCFARNRQEAFPPVGFDPYRKMRGRKKTWTDELDRDLRALWPHADIDLIQDWFSPKSAGAISKRASALGISRQTHLIDLEPQEVKVSHSFARGDRVTHQKFGRGRVYAVDGNRLTIEFAKFGSRHKTIMDSFVEPVPSKTRTAVVSTHETTRNAVAPTHNAVTERNCLGCGKKFASEGPHNRMCAPCRNQSGGMFDDR